MKKENQFNFHAIVEKEELSFWDCFNLSAILMSFVGALMNCFAYPTSGMALTMEVAGYLFGGFYISKMLKTDQSAKKSWWIFVLGVGLCSIFFYQHFLFDRLFHHAASIIAFTGSFGLFKYMMNYHYK